MVIGQSDRGMKESLFVGSLLFKLYDERFEGVGFRVARKEFKKFAINGYRAVVFLLLLVDQAEKLVQDDGDGKTDVAVFRPSTVTWYWRRSTDGVMYSRNYGVSGDIIVPGDYDGDGLTDFVVYRPSNNHWYILLPASNSFYALPMGVSGDIPIPGDYDGDFKSDHALWNSSTGKWTVVNSNDGTTTEAFWGVSGDKPVGEAFSY